MSESTEALEKEDVKVAGNSAGEQNKEQDPTAAAGSNKQGLAKGDRVRRSTGEGCLGTVLDVRTEVVVSTLEMKEKGLIVAVQWDNGTMSYFGPEGLNKMV